MEFDWAKAIERNRDDLLLIVTRLFLLAGLRTGVVVEMLPRFLRVRILALLRPAEFALRRLIVMAAWRLQVATPKAAARPFSPLPKSEGVGTQQHLPAFALHDPFKRYGSPWLDPDEAEDDWPIEDAGPDPDEMVDATGLCNRIRALEHALQDLDAQALRLARWRARRGTETVRPRRWSPLRLGLPPGWKKRPRTDIAEVVKECHDLARFALDTS